MIARNPNADTYRLGPEIIALGGRALRVNDLRTASRPQLKALATEVGETASLEILTGSDVLILDEVAGEHVMSGGQAIGTRWPAFATSTGKAILASLSATELQFALPDPLFQVTPKTIISLDMLHEDLAQTRERGYAVAREELELGLVAMAAPLRNYDGQVVGSIGLAGPTWRLDDRISEIGEKVKIAGQRISIQLGFQPDA
jgi:DNA-binding IclR family transcriptional regulator